MKDYDYLKDTYPHYINDVKFDLLGNFEKIILSDALQGGSIWVDHFYNTICFNVMIELVSWRDLSVLFSILADLKEITGYEEGGFVPSEYM